MKILMFAHSGTLNRGCEAIVRSGADIIKEKVTDSKIYLGSFDPKTDSHIPNLDEIFDARDNHIKKYSIDWIKSALKVKISSDESYAYQKIHSNIIKRINEMDICLSIIITSVNTRNKILFEFVEKITIKLFSYNLSI